MGQPNNTHGPTVEPLTDDQTDRLLTAARQSDGLSNLTVHTFLNTGVMNSEFCHLLPDWLDSGESDDVAHLEIPPAAECIGGIRTTGEQRENESDETSRDTACYACRTRRGGEWRPKSSAAHRRIPLTADAYELLSDWFEGHVQIPLLPDSARNRVREVADRAGLDRDVTPTDLRDTYAVKLLRTGLRPSTLDRLMGYKHQQRVPEHLDLAAILDEDTSDRDDDPEPSEGTDDN